MAKKVSVKEVESVILARKEKFRKPILFEDDLKDLKLGEGLKITTDEWSLKTSPRAYYYQKFRKDDSVNLSCLKTEDGYLIIKK